MKLFRKKQAFLLLLLPTIGGCGDAPVTETPPQPVPVSRHVPAPVAAASYTIEELFGKFSPDKHPDFEPVGKPYADRPGMWLRREAFDAFKKMHAAAKNDGVSLKIISSTRTFDQQVAIWNGKWTRFAAGTPDAEARARRILEFSSMPGSSRHHWGTDVDLNDLNNPAFMPGGAHARVYEWLQAHAHEYGFCQPYTAGRAAGYEEERWHWSYAPLSKPMLEQFQKVATDSLFTGFKGADMAPRIGIVRHYVLGINQNCKN